MYLLFPHMVLSEKDYRHLSVFLPRLHSLQVLRAPAVPEWGREQFPGWPAIAGPELQEQIRVCVQGYRSFGVLHGESSLLASLSHDLMAKDAVESRFRLQSELKGQGEHASDAGREMLIEAATFLEMALDLDEKEMELQSGLAKAEGLEEEFREILGITGDEEPDESLEALDFSLRSGNVDLSFMLRKRIVSWYRLFSRNMPETSPVFVAITGEVVEELLDPVQSAFERAGKHFERIDLPLGSIPSLEQLDVESFGTLIRELGEAGVLAPYWQAVEMTLRDPHNAAMREALEAKSEILRKRIESFCLGKGGTFEDNRVQLGLTRLDQCAHADIWKCSDRSGYGLLAKEGHLRELPSIVLSLS